MQNHGLYPARRISRHGVQCHRAAGQRWRCLGPKNGSPIQPPRRADCERTPLLKIGPSCPLARLGARWASASATPAVPGNPTSHARRPRYRNTRAGARGRARYCGCWPVAPGRACRCGASRGTGTGQRQGAWPGLLPGDGELGEAACIVAEPLRRRGRRSACRNGRMCPFRTLPRCDDALPVPGQRLGQVQHLFIAPPGNRSEAERSRHPPAFNPYHLELDEISTW